MEALEELFVPLAIFNNKKGKDAEVLKRYDEPAWNNPVVRFLDAQGKDVIARRDRVWGTPELAARMEQSLRTAKRDVPRWLTVVAAEGSSRLASETFTMSCFWQGEARLGGLDGVVQTEAGWEQGREVVQVRYDPRRITRDQLAREAATMHCARMPVSKGGAAPRAAKDSDRKYHLRRSLWQYLPLTPMQRTKVNATLGAGGDPAQWLSPRQVLLAQRLKALWASDRARLERLTPPASLESLAAYADQIEALTSSVDD